MSYYTANAYTDEVARYTAWEFTEYADYRGFEREFSVTIATNGEIMRAIDRAISEIECRQGRQRQLAAYVAQRGLAAVVGMVVGECIGSRSSVDRVLDSF